MRFEVPQFIDVKDKLFGPFTFRQGIFLAGGGGLVYLWFRLMPGWLAFFVAIPTVVFTLAFVFYKPNGQTFGKVLENYILYKLSSRFFLWEYKKVNHQPSVNQTTTPDVETPPPPATNQSNQRSKIRDISWGLDIFDRD